MRLRIFFLFIIMLPKFSFGQHFFRIEGDITIKEKGDFQSQLTIGKFYFDKRIGKLVYNVTFPEKQVLVSKDTTFYQFVDDSLVSLKNGFDMTRFSIFNLSLENLLNNYGLEKSFYSIEKVENEGDMVISTWTPGKTQEKNFGKVVISARNNRLYGIVFMNPAGEVVGKQFFEDYTVVNGLAFPKQMVKFTYIGTQKSTQLTTFENIKVNNLNEKFYYDYPLPAR